MAKLNLSNHKSVYRTFRDKHNTYKLVSLLVSQGFEPIPVGSPSHGGDGVVYVFDINQPGLPTLFYSVLSLRPFQLYFIP